MFNDPAIRTPPIVQGSTIDAVSETNAAVVAT